MNPSKLAVSLVVLLMAAFLLFQVEEAIRAKRKQEQPGSVNWAAVTDDPASKLTITFTTLGFGEDGGWVERLLEERFNVELKTTFIDSHVFRTKLPLVLAGGQTPDVFYPGGPTLVQKYVHHGFLLELPYEVLVRHAPNLVRLVNLYSPNLWASLSFEGRNFGIPFIWDDGRYPRPGVWRMDWLRKVGIHDVPNTLEEMEAAFRKFREQDPDNNGQKDTYGMTGDLMSWYAAFTEIFGAYGVLPFDWMERGGKVVYGGTLPETKEALALLRRWYQEGFIDPDFVIDRWYGTAVQKFVNGKVGYVNYQGTYEALSLEESYSLASMVRSRAAGAEVAVGSPPSGPEGKRGLQTLGAGGNLFVLGRHLAQHPEKVVRYLRMLDEIVTDEKLYIETRVGRQGIHWDWRNPSIRMGSGIRHLPPFDTQESHWKEAFTDATLIGGGSALCPAGGDPALFTKYLRSDFIEFRKKYRKPEWGLSDVFIWPDAVPRSDEFLERLRERQQTVFAEIIRGDRGLDAFDLFVQEWKAQGGEILLKEGEKLNQTRQEIFAKLGIRDP